jgi:WD40 repeat protein
MVQIRNAVSGLLDYGFHGHTHTVACVEWSPNGATIASGGFDKTVRLWDAVKRLPIHVLRGHTLWVVCIAWSPDGATIVSGSADKTVRLWNAVSGLPGTVLRSHRECVKKVAWSPDAANIMSCSLYTMQLCNVNNGLPNREFANLYGFYSDLAWSPKGKTVVVGCEKGTIIMPVCPWSDRDHHLFGPAVRRIILFMLCVRHQLEKRVRISRSNPVIIHKLPISLWLLIFELLLL